MNLEILLLEDNQEFAELQIIELEKHAYIVTWCQTIKEFSEAVASKSFLMIISDVNLPDGNSLSTLKQYKFNNNDVPVIVQTGNSSVSVVQNSFHLGAIYYLAKLFKMDEVTDVLHKYETLMRMKSSNPRLAEIAKLKFNLCNV